MAEESNLGVEAWLQQWLTNDAGVNSAGCTGIFPIFVPQSSDLSAVSYRRKSTVREGTMRGADGLAGPLFELAAWGRSNQQGYAEVVAIGNAMRLAVNGFQGSKDGHNISRVSLEDEYDDEETPVFDDGVIAIRRVLLVRVKHTEIIRNLIGGPHS